LDSSKEKNRRRYYRVRDILRVKYEVVPPERVESVKRLIAQNQRAEKDGQGGFVDQTAFNRSDFVDPGMLYIVEMLDRIDRKIDAISSRLSIKDEKSEFGMPVHVDLSASGMCFAGNEVLPDETRLHLAFILNKRPHQKIEMLARVVRIKLNERPESWGEEPYRIAVDFLDVDEATTDTLVEYVFQIQRGSLRNAVLTD
jgi:c-di-GMP-binding flagellar brake protein YcgR